MFRRLRILILLMILALITLKTVSTQMRLADWDDTLTVVVYPLNGDHRSETAAYIRGLEASDFREIETFLESEARRYELALTRPIRIRLGPPLTELPPPVPAPPNTIAVIWWSLKLRYWAYRMTDGDGTPADIRLFALYFDPDRTRSLDHSVGLEKGQIGIIKAFAARRAQSTNNVVFAHELLHTLGASDKYQGPRNLPLFPDGYAAPDQSPLYPQHHAEIMGGRIPTAPDQAEMPRGLADTLIGPKTAAEIHWLD